MSKPRTTEPERRQGTICFELPDDALEPEHPARALWQVLGTLELGMFLSLARAVEGHAGRPTHSPQMLLTLWTYAISQGVGSAREIERLVNTDRAFGWIVGDVAVSHHALSRFRIGHRAALDTLMTDILAALVHEGVLSLRLVALDGMRVRAAASAPSFRREASLLECREQAALHLKAVLAQADDPEHSLAHVRCATAGSELGGPRTVVAVELTNVGSDMGALTPMLAQIEARTGVLPQTVLADANHANHEGIAAAVARGVETLVAVPSRTRASGPNGNHEPAIAEWKQHMETDEAKRLYRARAGLCEWTNAQFAGRFDLRQFLVRGLDKTTSVALLCAITSNLTQHLATLAS